MDCSVCGETVVDDEFGTCKDCSKPFHLYNARGGQGSCGEETLDGDRCQTCLEKQEAEELHQAAMVAEADRGLYHILVEMPNERLVWGPFATREEAEGKMDIATGAVAQRRGRMILVQEV